ncbi:unnamed protein product [Protopolystoma xenopodis]|uniref:Uncharacterized protein n=1 Tax=Protopolystoma xenopodis TaxID=117903 RepID=A0A3S5BNF3_9PLAT|nr:unnamed protein product [Protopolystoma xenopodis]
MRLVMAKSTNPLAVAIWTGRQTLLLGPGCHRPNCTVVFTGGWAAQLSRKPKVSCSLGPRQTGEAIEAIEAGVCDLFWQFINCCPLGYFQSKCGLSLLMCL